MKARFLSVLQGALGAAESSWHAAGLAIDLVHLRGRLEHAQAVLADVESEAVIREAELAYLRRPGVLSAPSRSELVKAWTQLLLDATDKVERDEAWGDLYEAEAQERTDKEREFVRGSKRAAAARWRDN